MEERTLTKEERVASQWATACHLAGLAGWFVPIFGQILGPLIVWLIKRYESSYVDDQGREALNFQLSMTLYSLIATITIVGILLIPIIVFYDLVMILVAAVAASEGKNYRYPLTIRFFG